MPNTIFNTAHVMIIQCSQQPYEEDDSMLILNV